MIFLLLLLLFLTPCVSGTFVVNVPQTSYQAEENQNITLEWTFSTRTDTSLRSISTICQLLTEGRSYVLFHLLGGVESPESQDPQFAGRVQWDKDVLTEGRLTLHVSRLRTNDSGCYRCDIFVRPDESNSRRCWLNITAMTMPFTIQVYFSSMEVTILETTCWILFSLLFIPSVAAVAAAGYLYKSGRIRWSGDRQPVPTNSPAPEEGSSRMECIWTLLGMFPS
ncbi:butyrophilin-like protein 8 [Trematomus bernacchii]|uniref:butyrophilin-like protein 8 n=1 Tax=Trematomus bernacchii TaxID=40690 RepID=UPI00146B5BEC|nr:butyrophilin-like protein 8 [Trematomus bernacchii]XP_033988537.1 butyrophilin-like protein 8 [Trematomus bernacchii]XP_033988547.1 butyrophilin-like protein 8 [Trematomus bernacchii]